MMHATSQPRLDARVALIMSRGFGRMFLGEGKCHTQLFYKIAMMPNCKVIELEPGFRN